MLTSTNNTVHVVLVRQYSPKRLPAASYGTIKTPRFILFSFDTNRANIYNKPLNPMSRVTVS